jgi:hypothetical protein
VRTPVKSALTRVGARCSNRTIHLLRATVNYLEVGRWMRDRGFEVPHRVERREEIFELIAADVADQEVLYLEFGVFEGQSMRYWSRLIRNPRSHLHGFDSFEGLPARWSIDLGRMHFSTGGVVPVLDDGRVRFFKGWFEEMLPLYEPPPHERLVVNIDSDLYSSAAVVLSSVEPHMRPGSYLYFDEFSEPADELRAFDEFLDRTGMRFHVVAASRELTHVAFRRDG